MTGHLEAQLADVRRLASSTLALADDHRDDPDGMTAARMEGTLRALADAATQAARTVAAEATP